MIGILVALAAFLAMLLAVPALVLAGQVAAAVCLRPRRAPTAPERPRLAVLVPAHDEAAGIAATLDNLRPQLVPGDRLLVVADNCTDATAAVARARGAEAIERHDRQRRGKGYALDFGIRHLEADPPAVVVVVDADCFLAPGSLDILARRAIAVDRPIQAMDLMHSPAGAGLKTRLAEFACVVKNQVRPLGFYRLGLPCQLMGTGMAFPWPVIAGATLATGHIAEDMKLGLDLARAGTPPMFCPEALVTSALPAAAGLATQRTRWEHGHLGIIAAELPGLLAEAVRKRDSALLALALDLAVPPLALLCLLLPAVAGIAALLHILSGTALPLAVALGATALTAVAVLAAWREFGRRVISFGDLVAALGYVLWKLPLYLRFVAGRQVEWVRTRRDEP
ncbi:MAG TPA: glycosyltransferase family 2 protein [Rhodocyclaceae bacterium]|nr:glycosyltransferase family 2 protein [Rhodocyclaceae bacterium]